MLNSRYSNKDLVEMRSSRSTMSSSRSGSDDYSGYSLITNDHCVNAPRAKVFLVATISCVVAIIIVVVVIVTKVDETSMQFSETPNGCLFQEMCGNDGGDGCPKYAVVGAGLAGAYAAWYFNRLNQSVFLFEVTNRIGGKLYTKQFPNVTGVNLEMGLPYFVPKLSPLVSQLIDELHLKRKKYYGNNPKKSKRYYTRRKWVSYENVDSFSQAYNLAANEQHFYPNHLLRKTLQSVIPFEIPESPNATGYYSNDYILQTALLGKLSSEAYHYIQDMLSNIDFQKDANAAQYVEYLNNQEKQHVMETEDIYTLEDGMMSLPVTLVEEAQKNKLSFRYQPNYKLKQIHSKDQAVQLSFIKTVTLEDGTTQEIDGETIETCARNVILALPPKALKQLAWKPLQQEIKQKNLNSTNGLQSHVIYLLYNGTFLYKEIQNKSLWIHTDLPLGEVGVFHAEMKKFNDDPFVMKQNDNSTNENRRYNITSSIHTTEEPINNDYIYQPVTVVKAVFSARDYYHYWKSLLDRGEPINTFSSNKHQLTDVILEHIHLHLSEVLNMTLDSIPYPLDGYIEQIDNDSDSGSMSYIWKPGFNWNTVFKSLFKPDAKQNVYIVGQALAPSYYSFGVEGDLFTVRQLFK